jgi:5-oxoprolinase (ATP-hydrolysing)
VFVEEQEATFKEVDVESSRESQTSVYFEQTGRTETPVFLLNKLETGNLIPGPALIIDNSEFCHCFTECGVTVKLIRRHCTLQRKH